MSVVRIRESEDVSMMLDKGGKILTVSVTASLLSDPPTITALIVKELRC